MKKRMYLLCGIFALVIIIVSVFTACIHPVDNSFDNPPGSVHSHQWGEWTVTKDATCIEKGEKTRICTLDVTHIETREIAINPNAHDWQQLSGTAPTCTIAGNGTRKCNLCKKEENGALPALGHIYGNYEVTKEPTCSDEGIETATCSRDSSHTTTRAIPIDPNEHDWQQLSGTPATCTTEGSGKRECKLCNKEETLNIIPALGHNYANWMPTTAPTCTTAGDETGTCTHDPSHTTTRPVPAIGHQWANKWTITTPPTVVQEGIETDTCTHNTSHTRTRSITTATFTDIADLEAYLSGLSDNTAAAAYAVKLNVSSLGGNANTDGSVGAVLKADNTKYISLDLSGSTFTEIEYSAFFGCTSLVGIILPNSVTSIEDSVFNLCTGLVSVTLPNNLTSIGITAFNRCTNLASINIPNTVTSIGGSAFQSCAGLTSINIPNSVTSIEDSVFNRCTGLTSVTIPSSVTSIGNWAFGNNTNLVSVTFQGTIPAADFGTMGVFFGDLRDKFYATNATNGTAGTYTTTAPVSAGSVWTKK